MIDRITGVILAGGRSSRMGKDKALLPFQGKSLLECVHDALRTIFSRIVLSVHQADAFPNISLPRAVDRYSETGPMGGIASVLETGETQIFCVACDMPFLNKSLIEHLCSIADCDAVIPVWRGKIEVLHAIYSKAMLPHFQSALQLGSYRITDSLGEGHVRYVHEPEIKRFDPKGSSFKNVNTPTDYEGILES